MFALLFHCFVIVRKKSYRIFSNMKIIFSVFVYNLDNNIIKQRLFCLVFFHCLYFDSPCYLLPWLPNSLVSLLSHSYQWNVSSMFPKNKNCFYDNNLKMSIVWFLYLFLNYSLTAESNSKWYRNQYNKNH